MLTGISDSMVAPAPDLAGVLPMFLEFAGFERGTVLVAHNAPFDLSFLRDGCQRHGFDWPRPRVVDTAQLARKLLTRDEVPNCKLATLAPFFRSTSTPEHRALSDARATVDVLHGLLARAGSHRITTLSELTALVAAGGRVSPEQRRKRHLADAMPEAPGVYQFLAPDGEVLYIGKSANLRHRVRSYFTGSETRARIGEMVAIAEQVVPIECATVLEAEVRELRLIAEHKPRYNRRSKHPERAVWVRLTDEVFPRLSVVRRVSASGPHLGPFPSRRLAEEAVRALHTAYPIRQCNQRLNPRRPVSACALFEMGRCGAPCAGLESVEEYAGHVAAVHEAVGGDARQLVERVLARIELLATEERYEEAATVRDRLAAFLRAAARGQRLHGLTGCPQLVAARPAFAGGWELAVVRYGRLAAASVAPAGEHPMPYVEAAVATAETVLPGQGPVPAATAAETEVVLRWLEEPGTRLVQLDGQWCSPAFGAGSYLEWLRNAYPGDPVPGEDSQQPARLGRR